MRFTVCAFALACLCCVAKARLALESRATRNTEDFLVSPVIDTHLGRSILQASASGASDAKTKYKWQYDILRKASVNNRVIVCGANYGFRSWLQQWYVSLKRTGLSEIVIIALDKQVYDWALEKVGQDHVVHFDMIDESDDVAGDAHRWRTKSYMKVVSQRAMILKPIVEMGIDVLYADTDITWYKNPWEHVFGSGECNFYVQQEKSEVVGDYNCSGFLFIRASALMRLFMQVWEDKIIERVKKPGFFTDQEEMNILLEEIYRGNRKNSPDFKALKTCVLPPEKFPTGVQYYFKKVAAKAPKGGKGKGKPEPKLSSDCKLGKDCLGHTYVPVSKTEPKFVKTPPVIIHHNYIK
ncbi:hypothetical protein CYMTET_12950, partial [Cymbomonas tetramitiformis]